MYGHEGICSIFGKEWQISKGCKCLIKGLWMVVLGYRRNIYGFTLLCVLGSLCRFCGRAAVHGNVLALSLFVQMMHFFGGAPEQEYRYCRGKHVLCQGRAMKLLCFPCHSRLSSLSYTFCSISSLSLQCSCSCPLNWHLFLCWETLVSGQGMSRDL